jgi:hypothetical protein
MPVIGPGAKGDNSVPDISGVTGNLPAEGMAGTEGKGMPNCGSLVSNADPAYELSGMEGTTLAGKAGAGWPRKNSLAMRVNSVTSGSEPAWPMLVSSTGSLPVKRAAESSAWF